MGNCASRWARFAVGLCVLELAGETAPAAGELDVVEVDEFRDGTRLFSSGLGGLEHLVRVPALARARVEEHREWFVVNHFGFPFDCILYVHVGLLSRN